ncbi:C-type lectin domain-containing protein [Rhodovulum sp. DZ06]|uniref:C-type lectin domain-containing protein n=1 Tax=Rhodovulum sp. DZ06 TaxID=3425126 RepID=UPI003D325E53
MKRIVLTACAAAACAAGSAAAAPVQFADNGHWYELITPAAGVTWAQAQAAAEATSVAGAIGHLATITSAEEWAFVDGTVNPTGARAWLGGTDDAAFGTVEGAWIWAVGPEAGDAFTFTAWGVGEPNNSGTENFLEGWWNPTWNDIPGTSVLGSYVVEYSAAVSDVPLPAAAPLALVGLAALGFIGRRKG